MRKVLTLYGKVLIPKGYDGETEVGILARLQNAGLYDIEVVHRQEID